MYYQDNSRATNGSLCVFTYTRFRAIVHKYRSKGSLQLKVSMKYLLQELKRFGYNGRAEITIAYHGLELGFLTEMYGACRIY